MSSEMNQVGPRKILYLAPHQDDELLTLGASLCTALAKGEQVRLVLCSDGGGSAVRARLSNLRPCGKHPGLHRYRLSHEEFIAARDREFLGSCRALGLTEDQVWIPESRAVDGQVGVEDILRIAEEALERFPATCIRTMSPVAGTGRHPDHVATGLAVQQLLETGKVEQAEFFVEPYCVQAFKAEHPEIPLETTPLAEELASQIGKAVSSYQLWDPKQGRYAVGYHSVTTEFDDFLAAPAAYRHLPA